MQGQGGSVSSRARGTASDDRSYTARAAEAAHQRIDELKERIEPGEERLREAAAGAQGKLSEATAGAEDRLREARAHAEEACRAAADRTREYVREHPLAAAALAFAAGVLVVSWMRRKA
jgi:ElaB/YqjD/DUF883 family membrane-anchored ribosome-binding protein